MKFMKALTLILALIMAFSCFVACDTGDKGEEDVTTSDGYANHITVDIRVYTSIDPKKYTAYETDSLVLGAEALSVGYNDGQTVIATDVLQKLANERKATLTLSSSGGVDSIEFDGDKFTSGRVLSERKGTHTSQSGEEYEVYYYDLVYWEWTCNGQPIATVKNHEIKNGDKLVLRFVYDNTSTDNYESVESVDGTGEAAN